MKILSIAIFCVVANMAALNAQSNWTTINSSRGNFSFQFPQNSFTLDTLGLLSYINSANNDSTISLQVNFIDTVSISGNEEMQRYMSRRFGVNNRGAANNDPQVTEIEMGDDGGGNPCGTDSIEAVLFTYAQMYSYTTNGSIEGFIASDYTPCVIRGKELTIKYLDLSGETENNYFVFTRYFYWNGKFLTFIVSGPESKIWELYAYKNQIFNSIIIN